MNLTLFLDADVVAVGVPFLLQWNISLGKSEKENLETDASRAQTKVRTSVSGVVC